MKMVELELYNEQDQDEELIDEEARRDKFRLLGPLGQVYNIVAYIYRSTSRM
jgi:hypothetical protein